MKKLFWVFCALVCATGAVRADFVKFSETYKETLKEDEEEGGYFTVARVNFSAEGSVTIPGLSSNALNQLENIAIALGGLEYSFTLEEATTATANKLVFKIYKDSETEEEEEEADPVVLGTITLTRKGNVLSFGLSAEKLNGEEISIAARDHAGSDEEEEDPVSRTVRGSTRFGLSLGSEELSFGRTLYYKGTAKFKEVSKDAGEEDEEEIFTLATVEISGKADYEKPTISITSPKSNQRITNDLFLVTGKAADNREVTELNVQVNDDEPVSVDYNEEAGIWSAEVTLTPGTNTIAAVCVDVDGNRATAKVKCFRVLTNALTLIFSDGNDVTGVANGQVLEVGRNYKATAKPNPTNLFSHWTSSATEETFTNAMLVFRMEENLVLEAHFIANPWLPNAGTYNGLFLPVADVAPTNSGFITMTLTERGGLTGKVIMGVKTNSFTSRVDLDGNALVQITRAPARTLELLFDLTNGTGNVDGSVSNVAWQASLHAERQRPDPALAGKHTFAIPGAPAEESPNRPAGDGAGILNVKMSGSVTLAGNLGEGTAFTAGSGLSQDGDLPVHAVQFKGKGLFIGWLNVSTSSAPLTVTGESLIWFKPPGLADQKTYPGGFNEVKSLLGARYTPPPAGTNVLNWTNGAVLLDGGNLSSTISNVLTVAGTKLAAPGNTNKIALKLTASSGRLGGSFAHPARPGKETALTGYVLQMPDGDVGKGWFINTNQSGYLDLHLPAP